MGIRGRSSELVGLAILSLLVACGQVLMTWLVELDDREGFELYIRNDSERVHRITHVTLHECVNVEEACGTHRLDAVLCPGARRRVFTVHPETRRGGGVRAVAVAVALAAATAAPATGQAVLGRTVAESTEAPLAP